MIGGGERGHLVSVPGVLEEEELDFDGDLGDEVGLRNGRLACGRLEKQEGRGKQKQEESVTYLRRREDASPLLHELDEHAVWSTFLDLAQSAINGELVVGHAHVGLQAKGR